MRNSSTSWVEIDEVVWASINNTRSRRVPNPKTGKIVIKVINDYGDEVLKVFGVSRACES